MRWTSRSLKWVFVIGIFLILCGNGTWGRLVLGCGGSREFRVLGVVGIGVDLLSLGVTGLRGFPLPRLSSSKALVRIRGSRVPRIYIAQSRCPLRTTFLNSGLLDCPDIGLAGRSTSRSGARTDTRSRPRGNATPTSESTPQRRSARSADHPVNDDLTRRERPVHHRSGFSFP